MTFPTWPNVSYVYISDEDYEANAFAERLASAAKAPEVPPPCWDARPLDSDRCMEAVRSMSRGQ